MLSKEEIEICKEAAKNYIESVKKYDNVGWLRGLLWYIEQSETKIKELNKGRHSLMQSRRKWKNRYYKERAKAKDLQESVEQIYDDYQDIGKIAFDYSDKIEQLESDKKKTIEKLEKDANKPIPLAEDMDWIRCRKEYAQEMLSILKGENRK